jgi:hypothetical protein
MPGSCNDINDLQSSPLFTKLSYGESPPSVTFQTNSGTYNMGYYFVDGIFPKWPTFMKLIQSPPGKKELQFRNAPVAARKYVGQAFSILQAQFPIEI